MKVAFDVGMFDGADTEYLLASGFRVIAVEANPALCQRAGETFAEPVRDGRLIIVNKAVAAAAGAADLSLCSDDLGSSSIVSDKIGESRRAGELSVATIPMTALFVEYGIPEFLKVDIEGADRHCILPLTRDSAPHYLSFEVDEDVEELVDHVATIGYSRFKLIGQCSFLEIDHELGLSKRLRDRLMHMLGYDEPERVWRNGRWFRLMHSSGPGPWESDGSWYSAQALLGKWQRSGERGTRQGWYDVHAMR